MHYLRRNLHVFHMDHAITLAVLAAHHLRATFQVDIAQGLKCNCNSLTARFCCLVESRNYGAQRQFCVAAAIYVSLTQTFPANFALTHNCNEPALVSKVTRRHSISWEPNSHRWMPCSPRIFKLATTKSLRQALVSPKSDSSIQFKSQIVDMFWLCISPHIVYDNLIIRWRVIKMPISVCVHAQ